MKNKRYVIQDWTGRILDVHGTFNTFDDAWEYIHQNFENEEDYQDLYVERVKV